MSQEAPCICLAKSCPRGLRIDGLAAESGYCLHMLDPKVGSNLQWWLASSPRVLGE